MSKSLDKKTVKKCVNCNSEKELHVHHIVPLTVGGTNNESNLTVLCIDCHSKVHSTKLTRKELLMEGKRKAKQNKKDWSEGRPRKFSEKQIIHALNLLEEHSYYDVQKMTGISKSTLIREKKRMKKERSHFAESARGIFKAGERK